MEPLGAALFAGNGVVDTTSLSGALVVVVVAAGATVVVAAGGVVVATGGVVVAAGGVVAAGTAIVTVSAVCTDAGPVFVAASVTLFCASFAMTVPSDVHETSTRIVTPDVDAGENVQPVAVPVFEKSLADSPEMDSEKV